MAFVIIPDTRGLVGEVAQLFAPGAVRPNMDQWVESCWLEGKAVENGIPMTQLADVGDVPAAVLDGPAFWFRGRDDS
jgi:hypothetical protein